LKRNKGFTLIEIVLVLVIVGLLASIIIPKMTLHRDKAKEVMTRQNLESMRKAIKLYHAQEGEWPDFQSAVYSQLSLGTSPSGAVYISKIPTEGYLLSNTPHYQIFCPSSSHGGWCWDYDDFVLYPNLPDNDPLYNNVIFSSW